MPRETRPNHRYFQTTHGFWRSRFHFGITSWSAFWACPMAWMDRLRVVSMVLTPKLIGSLYIRTQVDYETAGPSRGEVLHTTEIVKWGLTMMRSHETFVLDDNGRDIKIHGQQWFWPTLWRARPFADSPCRINEEGTEGRYSFSWFGTRLEQTTAITPSAARIEMRTAWSLGVQELRRVEA